MQRAGKLSNRYYMLICILIILFLPLFLSSSAASLGGSVRRPTPQVMKKRFSSFAVRKVPAFLQAQEQSSAVQSVALWYMQAFLAQRYTDMWLVLHPHIRQKWPDEAAFAAFWRRRFQEYTLQGFSLGTVRYWPTWTDPDTLQRYTHLMGLSVSLQLVLKHRSHLARQLPPEDLHPAQLFYNLPFVVQYRQASSLYVGRWLVLVGGPADLNAPILPPVTPVKRSVQVPILVYHHVLSSYSMQPLSDYFLPWVVNPAQFDLQMEYLSTHGYHAITLNRLFDALYYGGPLPSKPIVLTFDDGDEEHYRLVYPILLQHHFTAMFYIITGQVGWPSRLGWPQIREMLAHGMQIGSHTVNHVHFSSLLNISEVAAQQELQLSRQTLEHHLGIIVQQFCYPFGDPLGNGTWYQRQLIVAMLAADGYVGATTFGEVGSVQDSSQPFALLRIPVYGTEAFSYFVGSLPFEGKP
jgi:peptidoglycan/xylan/chitin deacetylase (PgdA/CDA1 family)